MKTMMRVLLLGGFLIAGYYAYQSYHEEKHTQLLLEKLKAELEVDRAARGDCTVDASPQSASLSWSKVQERARNAVIQVLVYQAHFNWVEPYKTPRQSASAGSGFFISQDGLLVTNAHVVDQAKVSYIQIPHFGKRRFDVEIMGICPDRDLALLRVIPGDLSIIKEELGELPVLSIGDSDEVHRADEIMALGFPLGQDALKSTVGVVSGFQRLGDRASIQIDAAINPGSSGGPSVNKKGEIVGVNSRGINDRGVQNTGYIIPGNELKLFLRQLETSPSADNGARFLRKPYLGIIFNEMSDVTARYLGNPVGGGCYIQQVYPGSPLERAGIKDGDVLYEVDGYKLDYFGDMQARWSEDRTSFIDYLARLMPDDPIHMVIYRKGKRKEVVVQLEFTQGPPIRTYYPGYETIDYEMVGGMVIMELSLNHLPVFAEKNVRLAHFLTFENQMEPALLITHVLSDSVASRARIVHPGSLINEINGQKVSTLKELREQLVGSVRTGYLTLRLNGQTFTVLPFDKALKEEPELAKSCFYTVSPFIQSLAAA